MTNTFHSYEPCAGHRLHHDPLIAIVGPRPIGWISTRAPDGVLNLAPYSFFNAFCYVPPIVGFSSIGYKDTVRNVEATREFVWNLVTKDLVGKMNTTCAMVPPEVDEFALAGLTPLASTRIGVPRVAESPVSFECRVIDIVRLGSADGVPADAWLTLGEVVQVHIAESSLKDGNYLTATAGHVLRGGGPADYFDIGPDQLFRLHRPK
jgi:flavin reductase (DIM6/NTAB) family NADH-FMN oxidoreductase RutF